MNPLVRTRTNEFVIQELDLNTIPSYSKYLSTLSFEGMLRDVAASNELIMECVYIPLRDDDYNEDGYTELDFNTLPPFLIPQNA